MSTNLESMTSRCSPSSSRPSLRSAAWAGALAVSVPALAEGPSTPPAATQRSAPGKHDRTAPHTPPLVLPAVPRLQLPLPWLVTSSWRVGRAMELPDGRTAAELRPWRAFSDAELRLDLEVWRWQLGRFSIATQLGTVPERERDCSPDCRGPGWSSSVRLKLDGGDIGPLREAGPSLDVGLSPEPVKNRGSLLRGGFRGRF